MSDKSTLISQLTSGFSLSDAEIEQMNSALLAARTVSAKASYRKASDTVGIDGRNWKPSEELQQQLKNTSEKEVEGIVGTYQSDLEKQVTNFVDAWLKEHETLDGCEEACRKEIALWASERAAWKSEQIGNYAASSGADSGTNAWIDDLVGDEFEGVNPDDVEVIVLPETSSSDICEEYAGKTFSIDDYDTIISFPVHPYCDHRVVVQMKDE